MRWYEGVVDHVDSKVNDLGEEAAAEIGLVMDKIDTHSS